MKRDAEAGRPPLLVLSSTFPRHAGDGGPAFVFELCRRLAADWEVTVLAPHAPGAALEETLASVHVRRFRYAPARWERLAYDGGMLANLKRRPWLAVLLPSFFLALMRQSRRAIRELAPAAVHAHWFVPQGLALAMAAVSLRRLPRMILTAHGSDVSALRGPFWRALRRGVAARLDAIVAVSTPLAAQLAGEGCARGKTAVIPMGADLTDCFTPLAQPVRSRDEILFVGRLAHEKGADILLAALPRILERRPQAMLTLIGDGPEKVSLRDTARRLGVEQCVRFLGALPQAALAEHYRRAALLVLPSRREGFGLVLAEALGCGCPVAAADLPAVRELLDGGDGGRLFRAEDVEALAAAVLALLTDPDAAAALARRGRARVLELCDWHVVARRYDAMLRGDGAA